MYGGPAKAENKAVVIGHKRAEDPGVISIRNSSFHGFFKTIQVPAMITLGNISVEVE